MTIKIAIVQSSAQTQSSGALKKALGFVSNQSYANAVDSVVALIAEAASQGAELICFPELYIPGSSIGTKDISQFAVAVDSSIFNSLINSAKKNDINVVLGFAERAGSDIYNSQCIISTGGELVMKRHNVFLSKSEAEHLKQGDKSDVDNVAKLKFKERKVSLGVLGSLEHANPLLTFNSAVQHEEIHVGLFSSFGETKEVPFGETEIKSLAKAYAMQSGSFFILAAATGKSLILKPDGADEELGTLKGNILYHNIDLSQILLQKQLVDIVGHYSRPDMISLQRS